MDMNSSQLCKKSHLSGEIDNHIRSCDLGIQNGGYNFFCHNLGIKSLYGFMGQKPFFESDS